MKLTHQIMHERQGKIGSHSNLYQVSTILGALGWDKDNSAHTCELELFQQQIERERDEWAQERAKLLENAAAKMSEEEAKLKTMRALNNELQEQSRAKDLTVADAAETLCSVQKKLEFASAENLQLKLDLRTSDKDHQEVLSSKEKQNSAAYERLLHELKVFFYCFCCYHDRLILGHLGPKVYRERTSKLLNQQKDKISEQSKDIQQMQDELAHGKHGERRFFELAELQVTSCSFLSQPFK